MIDDPILFTDRNIEHISAKFQTRDAQGAPVKQRLKIRAALRLLNEFKKEGR